MVMWIHGLRGMFLVHGRGEMAVLPAVAAVLLHHSAMDTWSCCSVVITGWSGNSVSACSYCSTVEPSGLIPEFGVLPLMLGRGPALPRLMPAVLWAVRPGRGIPEVMGLVQR